MNLDNLQRDQTHVGLDDFSILTYSGGLAKGSGVKCNNTGVVGEVINYAYTIGQSPTVSAGNTVGLGAYLEGPKDEAVSYRVKAHYIGPVEKYVFIGIGPASITGTDDIITPVVLCPFSGDFDEVFLVQPFDSAAPEYGRPICIGLALGETSTTQIDGFVSMQRLDRFPPY